jgi:hypothetical protein
MKNKLLITVSAILVVTAFSCTKENLDIVESEVIREWSIPIAAANILPATANRLDTGTVNFQLFSDNSIRYELNVKRVTGNDVLNGASLKSGDPVTNGSVVLNLTPTSKFTETTAVGANGYGVVTGVRQSLIDSLKDTGNHLYFELYSVQQPDGMARGQLNERIELAADITLTGNEEVPVVNTTAIGKTWLRLTSGGKLYSRISITNNEPGDPFTMAHIHKAQVGANGPIIVTLASSTADFEVSKSTQLSDALYNSLLHDGALYVNAHSQLFPAGKIRGQLRN